MKRRTKESIRKQLVTDDLCASCLDFLQRKFYPDRDVVFKKDRDKLLEWVVLWPAHYFDEAGVTIGLDQYRDIFMSVFMDAAAFRQQTKINYLPAYLAQVIQSHFRIHGEDYYRAAKSLRTLAENALSLTGKLAARAAAPDPVHEMANAYRLLRSKKLKTPPSKPPVKDQLTLL